MGGSVMDAVTAAQQQQETEQLGECGWAGGEEWGLNSPPARGVGAGAGTWILVIWAVLPAWMHSAHEP